MWRSDWKVLKEGDMINVAFMTTKNVFIEEGESKKFVVVGEPTITNKVCYRIITDSNGRRFNCSKTLGYFYLKK